MTDNEQLSTLFCSLSTVADEPKRYIFRPWLPLGKITLFSADPGVGKTKAALALAALVTRGNPLLGVPCGQAGNVLIFSAEDDAADLKETLISCGGDAERVMILSEKEEALSLLMKKPVTFRSQIIEQAIAAFKPVLVVFDPFQRYAGRTDTNSATETNAALMPLTVLGKKYGCAFLLIAHNNKGNHNSLMHKSSGSNDIPGNARSMLSIVRDPESPNQCIAIHSKSNNARGKSIRYEIQPIPGNEDFATVEWISLEDYTERDYWKALRQKDEKEFAAQVSDDDPVVKTILGLIRDNPTGIRLRKQDFWTAVEIHTEQIVADGIEAIVKKYRRYLWDKHEIFIDSKTAQTLKPFKINGQEIIPSKSPDRCIAIYRKRETP